MDTLRQRLKELDRDKFEDLTFHLLKARHPDANIRKVEGTSGDQGVDTFAGDLQDGPTIWQAKSFPNGIKESQKKQIRESLAQVVRHHHPRRWILCVSIDLDIKAHEWFQRLAKTYANTLTLGLLQASDITSELLHRRTLRDHYFPDAGLNVNELRALITKTGTANDDELGNITTENAAQYIERLKYRDARFDYELVISTDRPPTTTNTPAFSISNGPLLINAYARDTQALRDDPIKLNIQFTGTGVEKITTYLKTGRPTRFTSEEITSFRTTIGFPELETATTIDLGARASNKPLPTRVTFGNNTGSVVYDLINFIISSVGTDEVTLTSTSNLPFTLTVIIREKQGTFTIDEHLTGLPVRAVKKYADALTALKHTGEVQLYDLEDERRIFRAITETQHIPSLDDSLVRLITDASIISESYNVNLTLPGAITDEDAQTLGFLKALHDGTMPINDINATMTKDENAGRWITDVANGKTNVGLKLDNQGTTRTFAGVSINTGPYEIIIDQLRFKDPHQTLADYDAAPAGAMVPLTIIPVTTPRARRHTQKT